MISEKLKLYIVKWFMSYGVQELSNIVKSMGVRNGDVVMVHSSWLPKNGFNGRPIDFIRSLQGVLGEDGLLIMPSLPYHNESTKEFLSRGKLVDVRRTPSMMGLLTEVFRRNKDVKRSLSASHPLLACGKDRDYFVDGHELCEVPFGRGSPFEKLMALKGKILTVDAPFSSITFTHFLEDRIANILPFPLYENDCMTGLVTDYLGVVHEIPTKVLSAEANALRREERLLDRLVKNGVIVRKRIGNTRLMLIECQSMVDCVDEMYSLGDSFFDNQPIKV